jgi:HK97 family phage major capsid protein
MGLTMSNGVEQVLAEIKQLRQEQENQAKAIADLQKPATKATNVFGTPAVRSGENSMSSRGYSFLRLAGFCAGVLPESEAKVELEVHNLLQKELVSNGPYQKARPNSILTPFGARNLSLHGGDGRVADQVRDVVKAGVGSFDADAVAGLRRSIANGGGSMATVQKALSWVDETTGGALVGPASFGELIEVFRNNEAFLNAGAIDIGMPPTGRITYPRQTGATTAYWVGENSALTDSTPTFGDLTLMAKKLGILAKIPNELYRFPTIAAEAVLRMDMGKVMALALDKELLEGPGSTLKPKGIINYSGVTKLTAGTTGTNGDTFAINDVQRFVSTVEEQNSVFKAFIMRPGMFNAIINRRSDAVTAGDGAGLFVYNLTRAIGEQLNMARAQQAMLQGYPVVKSTNVSKTRVKGSGSTLTYILGGDFADFVLAMSGVIEFLVANQGDTMVQNDQTWLRGIQYVDGAPRHEASFVWMDNLLVA